jgi:hypothetical protein
MNPKKGLMDAFGGFLVVIEHETLEILQPQALRKWNRAQSKDRFGDFKGLFGKSNDTVENDKFPQAAVRQDYVVWEEFCRW